MELATSDIHQQAIDSFDTRTLLRNAARQRDAGGLTNFPVIDVDSHHYENESMREII